MGAGYSLYGVVYRKGGGKHCFSLMCDFVAVTLITQKVSLSINVLNKTRRVY